LKRSAVAGARGDHFPLHREAPACPVHVSWIDMESEDDVEKTVAPTFLEMVRDREPVTLGEAKQYALTLGESEDGFCGCYAVRHTSCPGCPIGFTPVCVLGTCLWIPQLFVCTCKDEYPPHGASSCVDLKGNHFSLYKVDADHGTLALFAENECAGDKGDSAKAQCYFT